MTILSTLSTFNGKSTVLHPCTSAPDASSNEALNEKISLSKEKTLRRGAIREEAPECLNDYNGTHINNIAFCVVSHTAHVFIVQVVVESRFGN